MQVTDELIRNVVQEVLTAVRNGQPAPTNGQATPRSGVFDDVDSAVAAATDAQREFEARGLEGRRKAVDCIRKICIDKAEQLGLEEFEETKIGRLKHKVEKLIVAGDKTPGRRVSPHRSLQRRERRHPAGVRSRSASSASSRR